jgi:hypothetical protein
MMIIGKLPKTEHPKYQNPGFSAPQSPEKNRVLFLSIDRAANSLQNETFPSFLRPSRAFYDLPIKRYTHHKNPKNTVFWWFSDKFHIF